MHLENITFKITAEYAIQYNKVCYTINLLMKLSGIINFSPIKYSAIQFEHAHSFSEVRETCLWWRKTVLHNEKHWPWIHIKLLVAPWNTPCIIFSKKNPNFLILENRRNVACCSLFLEKIFFHTIFFFHTYPDLEIKFHTVK